MSGLDPPLFQANVDNRADCVSGIFAIPIRGVVEEHVAMAEADKGQRDHAHRLWTSMMRGMMV
jgi:hypothetical protein